MFFVLVDGEKTDSEFATESEAIAVAGNLHGETVDVVTDRGIVVICWFRGSLDMDYRPLSSEELSG